MAGLIVGPGLGGLPGRLSMNSRHSSRTSISSAHAAKNGVMVNSKAIKEEKPLMQGSGITCNIQLTEPNVYLSGFDTDGRSSSAQTTAALIRGRLILNVQKSAKIKAVTLRFYGIARTEWPEGIPPEKTQYWEEEKLRYQVLPFFNATYANNDVGFGAMCSYILKDSDTSSVNSSTTTLHSNQSRYARTTTAKMSSRDQRRLSLSTVQARSFQKQESQTASIIQQKGYKTFHPGVYEYSFEITLDHTSPESMSLPMGSVKWYLDAMVERAGTFKPNLHGVHELNVVRAPDQSNLETVEPIAINRSWEDQLHYDIVISGKSFPIGGRIPIAFKLTPLAKVQLHRIKVYVTENVEYFCNNRKVTRKDAQKKILLLEKNAGKPLAPEYSGSSIRNAAGGEQSPEARERARRQAEAWRQRLAKHSGQPYTPLPPPTDNLLGDLDLGLDHLVMQTEIEMDVQLPTCEQMAKDKTKLLHPGTTYKNIVVNHWIKIVMRLSRVDTDDPLRQKRRHFEISIDSPFHILSCLATTSHTSLPTYKPSSTSPSMIYQCGCPNAASTPSPASSTNSVGLEIGPDGAAIPELGGMAAAELAVPPQAHTAAEGGRPEGPGGVPVHAPVPTPTARPMHLLRVPSYNPPAFSADDPPPALETPPPLYDHVVGTPSVDGLADYFARLSAFGYDSPEDDEGEEGIERIVSRGGAVNVRHPRTPGGRNTSRSMEINRDENYFPRVPIGEGRDSRGLGGRGSAVRSEEMRSEGSSGTGLS